MSDLRVDTDVVTGAAPAIRGAGEDLTAAGSSAAAACSGAAGAAGDAGLAGALSGLSAAVGLGHQIGGLGMSLLASVCSAAELYAHADADLAARAEPR